MIVPSARLLALASLPLAATVAYVLWAAAWPAVVGCALGVGVIGAVDALAARRSVVVQRTAPAAFSVGRAERVTFTVVNGASRPRRVLVDDALPGEVVGLPALVDVPAGAAMEVQAEVRLGARGRFPFGPTTSRVASPMGLWWWQTRHHLGGEARVLPDFSWLRRQLRTGRVGEDRVPVRVRRRPGGESEYERNRPYVVGDPMRHVDWKATARSQRLVVREYGQEANQNVVFLVDCGRMSGVRLGELSALDHALNASLAMAHVALRRGDRVAMLAFDAEARAWVPPGGGLRHAHRLLHAVLDVAPSEDEPDFAAALRFLASRVRRRSLVVIVADLHDELGAEAVSALTRALRGRHLPLLVWLRDPALDAMAAAPAADDAAFYARAAAADLVGWREERMRALRAAGVLVVDTAPSDLGPALLERYAEIKARRLL